MGSAKGSFETPDGTRIAYEIEGEGRVLALIHGWSLNLRMWDDQVPSFSRAYRVVRYDRRGFGRSGGHEDTTRDPGDLRALLAHLEVSEAIILGMSQGAWIALSFALAHPDMVRALILQGPQAPSGFGLPWEGPDRFPQEEYRRLAKESGLLSFRRAWLRHPLLSVPADRPELRARLETMMESYTGGDLLNQVPQSKEAIPPHVKRLSEIAAPTLVLTGSDEIPYFRVVAEALVYALPNASRAVVEGGGHLINMIEPQKYNDRILEFLREVDAED
jgi:3-oxoadipate enol-lactonase